MAVPISVIIVSWNVKDKLRLCLKSLLTEEVKEIVVVDNNSADGSAEMVKHEFPQVTLLAQDKNLGFARGVNQGIINTTQDIILLLNPDTQVKTGSLSLVIEFFRKHQQAGIVGGQLLNHDGSIQLSVRRWPTFFSQLAVLLKLGYIFPSLLNNYLVKDFNYYQAQIVGQVSGAYFFINRQLIKDIGVMDENFFLWFEEVDYCKRVHEAGWQIWYVPQAVAQHISGASFKQLSHTRRQLLFGRSLSYFFHKHHSTTQWLIIKITTILVLLPALILDLSTVLWHLRIKQH